MNKTGFKCLPNCAECCGLVPIPKEVYERNKNKIRPEAKTIIESEDAIMVYDDKMKCGFLKDYSCQIYEDRPDLCRKFGLINELPCPYLHKSGRPRLEKDTKKIIKRGNKKALIMIRELVKLEKLKHTQKNIFEMGQYEHFQRQNISQITGIPIESHLLDRVKSNWRAKQ